MTWLGEGEHLDRSALLGEALGETDVVLARPNELVGRLADRMAQTGLGRVPVVDEANRLIGLVARKDLLAARARRIAEEQDYAVHLRLRRKARAAEPSA
jgi:CBS domain-containing protein